MQKETFTIDSIYKGPKLLECMAEKYKKSGSFTMLAGNKQKKWLILDLSKNEFRYQPDQAHADKAKQIKFDDIEILRVDLSKPGKYYIDMVTRQRPYRFKFPNIDSWVVFTEALRHVKSTKDKTPLFKSTEDYLSVCIKYHEQYDHSPHPKTAEQSLMIDKKDFSGKDAVKGGDAGKQTAHIKADVVPKAGGKDDDRGANNTMHPPEVKRIEVKEKRVKLESDSEDSHDNDKQQNEIVKKRKNV